MGSFFKKKQAAFKGEKHWLNNIIGLIMKLTVSTYITPANKFKCHQCMSRPEKSGLALPFMPLTLI